MNNSKPTFSSAKSRKQLRVKGRNLNQAQTSNTNLNQTDSNDKDKTSPGQGSQIRIVKYMIYLEYDFHRYLNVWDLPFL